MLQYALHILFVFCISFFGEEITTADAFLPTKTTCSRTRRRAPPIAYASTTQIRRSKIPNDASDKLLLLVEDHLRDLGMDSDQITDVLRHSALRNSKHQIHLRVLAWLRERFTCNQTTSIIQGLPSILTYDIDKRLEPTIHFFQEALELDVESEISGDKNKTISSSSSSSSLDEAMDTRLADFLCSSPGLLEYNVAKRLLPRLHRVLQQRQKIDPANCNPRVDEQTLTAIATKTDTKFEEWLTDPMTRKDPQNDNQGEEQGSMAPGIPEIERTPPCFVVLSNLQSGANIGNILRSASIFGCQEILVVGQKRLKLTGDHGSRLDLPRRHVWSHTEARDYLHDKNVCIYGVEIMDNALPIMSYNATTGVVELPFDHSATGGAAFVMGNEGQGLSPQQKEICDNFVYIPQTRGGSTEGGGSASLNVACAASIILQAYCLWASYPVAERSGEKFVASSASGDNPWEPAAICHSEHEIGVILWPFLTRWSRIHNPRVLTCRNGFHSLKKSSWIILLWTSKTRWAVEHSTHLIKGSSHHSCPVFIMWWRNPFVPFQSWLRNTSFVVLL